MIQASLLRCRYRNPQVYRRSAARNKHPVVLRAEESRRQRNQRFWEAHAEWRKVMADYEADESRSRVEDWAERIAAAEEKMLVIGVTSATAVRCKLMVTDDPASYPLPGEAKNLLQMVCYDLERISMLELTGISYPGETA